jgi:hypothetical protein
MPAPDDIRIHPQNAYPEPPPGKAIIYFYNDQVFLGLNYFIWENDKKIGAATPDFYFFINADPGDHYFYAETEAKGFVYLKAEAGKKYYVECSWSMGFITGRPRLSLVPEHVALPIIKDLKYATLK